MSFDRTAGGRRDASAAGVLTCASLAHLAAYRHRTPTGSLLSGSVLPLAAGICAARCPIGAELFEDVRAVWGYGRLDDVVLLGDFLALVSELCGGVLGAGFLVD